jgi:hypothetical protein
MFDQVRHAILPPMGLQQALQHWHEIAKALADTPRQRTRQLQTLKSLCKPRN